VSLSCHLAPYHIFSQFLKTSVVLNLTFCITTLGEMVVDNFVKVLSRNCLWKNIHNIFVNKFILNNVHSIKLKEIVGNPQDTQNLLEKSKVTVVCATALREVATVQEDSCWSPLFSLCVGPGRPENRILCTWAHSHSNVTANPSPEFKGNLRTTTYSFLLHCTA
jgi:hypothetical protein